MHTTLAVVFSTLFLASTASAHTLPPQPRSASLDDKCTFALWHKQIRPNAPPTKTNYIQINTLVDHANDITIDVRQTRPKTAFNSYTKISSKQVFTIGGLLDGKNLTVRGDDGMDNVRFEYDGLMWSTENAIAGEAWCDVGKWDTELDDVNRERKVECAFPCEAIEEEEEEEEEREELR